MGQTTGFLTKSLTATTAIAAYRLVNYGAADGAGVPAADATKFIVGVNSEVAAAIGERASIHSVGNIADVEYGGNVARGDPLTSDAQGRAIKATTTGQHCVGYAEVSGVSGDIGSCTVTPFTFAAAA